MHALTLASAVLTCAAPSGTSTSKSRTPALHAARGTSNSSTAGTKIILDNDWSTAGFIPYLMALDAGWDVLGLVGDTGDSWALQTSLHGLATLEVGGLASCIPVYKGADYPLINTPELFQTWEDLHGDLPWVRRIPLSPFPLEYRPSSTRSPHPSFEVWQGFHRRANVVDVRAFSKAPSPARTSPTRRWATTRRAATRSGWSGPPSTRGTPTARWRATTARRGWWSRSGGTRAR